MKRTLLCLISTLFFTTISANSTAALISIDDPMFGVGSLTRDTETGIDWLDPTFTTDNPGVVNATGRLTADILANLGVGGDFEGFRLATAVEFAEFLTNAGITYSTGCCGTSNAANGVAISAWQTLVGVTQSFSTDGTKGLLAAGQKGEAFNDGSAFIWANAQLDAGGHWLVRNVRNSSVPVPATFALLGLGLAGIGYRRKRIKAA